MSEEKDLVNSLVQGAEVQKSDISVTLKRNEEKHDEIDLVNIFKYMGKKRGIFITLIIFLAVAGLCVGLFLAEIGEETPEAQALVYNNSLEGISSAYVVKDALAQAGLSDKLTIDSVRNNIVVSRVLKAEYRQKLSMYTSMKELSEEAIEAILGTTPEYEDTYIVSLKNGFGKDGQKVNLKDSELTLLLNCIIYQYDDYCFEQNSSLKDPAYGIGGFDYSTVEYSQAVNILKQSFDSLSSYCSGLAGTGYSKGGVTFGDMASLINLSYKAQASYFEAYIFYTNTIRDTAAYETYYSYLLSNYKSDLATVESNIKYYDTIIKEFKNETITFISTGSDKDQQSIVKNLDAYNNLVLQQEENKKEKAYYEKLIADCQERLDKISTGTVGVHDYAEYKVNSIIDTYDELYKSVCDMTDSYIASSGYQSSFLTYTTAGMEDVSFLSEDNLKKIAGCFGGAAFAGVLVWVVYGVVMELKRTSKKKEGAKHE